MIARPISRPISRSIARAINEQPGGAFNPLSLFSAGEQGAWYDPSDLSTLFQDTAGTTPVTAAGQPVGLMRDKSGRGNHATQATATSRPILQTASGLWYLAFDGVDDWMQTANIDCTVTDKMTVFAGAMKNNDIAAGMLCEFGTSTSVNGSFNTLAPNTALNGYSGNSRGTTAISIVRSPFMGAHTAVLAMQSDISAPSISMRVNTTTAAPVTASQGTGNYGNLPLYIGRRAGSSLPFNGNLYGLIIRGVKSTDAEITQTESWMNSKTGAY